MCEKKPSDKAPENQLERCGWCGDDALYQAYHDEEWGVPVKDDTALFAKLCLESFQAGLSWITILKKRETFFEAFEGFNPEVIARFDKQRIEKLLGNPGIVRNRLKVEAVVNNASALLKIVEKESFAEFVWREMPEGPVINRWKSLKEVPGKTPASISLAKRLKKVGFKFVGPTTSYAFMQSVGMVNDHVITCFRHEACTKLMRAFIVPRNQS